MRPKPNKGEVDISRGIYRRQYAGFIHGKRINSVPAHVEAWFWRFNAIADDFGNFPADEVRLHAETKGRRDVRVNEVSAWLADCVRAKLIATYEAKGDTWGHIIGFTFLQPGPPNGRRVRKYPPCPALESADDVESGGTLLNPGESGCNQEQDQGQVQEHQQEQDQRRARPANAAPAAAIDPLRKAEIQMHLRKPDWLPNGKPWISPVMAARLAESSVDPADVAAIVKEARESRNTLTSPAGFIVKRVMGLVGAKAGGAA